MGTRTNIHFNYGTEIASNIYRHYDGYPGKVENGEEVEYGVLPDLLRFFRDVKEHAVEHGPRFGDPTYLAAKFVVWQAKENTRMSKLNFDTGKREERFTHHLDFLSLGVCVEDLGGIEFIYEVDCDDLDAEGFPSIRWKPAHAKRWRKKIYFFGKPVKATG